MILIETTIITKAIAHNLNMENEKLILNDVCFECDSEEEQSALKKIFLKPFTNNTVTLEFKHPVSLEYNVLFNLAKNLNDNQVDFVENSKNITKHLQEISKHPNIKSGDVFVLQLQDVLFNNNHCDGMAIYKVENKETFLETKANNKLEINFKKGIGSKKLDKALLLLFTPEPYTVFTIDNTGGDADYWKNEFAKIDFKEDNVNCTHQFLNLTKDFVTKHYPTEFEVTKADQIDLLNRSVEYFKTHEVFDKQEFTQEVLHHKELITAFNKYNTTYEKEHDTVLNDDFEISTQAVKKQQRIFKSVLKLDKNFHVYIHGNREFIEQGIDPDGRKFYKLYFENEN
jgi:hypothetical protein